MRERLREARYPQVASFTFASLAAHVDSSALQQSFHRSIEDGRTEFAGCIETLCKRQAELMQRMAEADALSKQTLQVARRRTRTAEKDAETLVNCEKLSKLCETTYSEVERIVALFAKIDRTLPPDERIGVAAAHYDRLAPLIAPVASTSSSRGRTKKQKVTNASESSHQRSVEHDTEVAAEATNTVRADQPVENQSTEPAAGATYEPPIDVAQDDAQLADESMPVGQSVQDAAETTRHETTDRPDTDVAAEAADTRMEDITEETNEQSAQAPDAPQVETPQPRPRRKPSQVNIRGPALRTRTLPPLPDGTATSQHVTSRGSIVSTFDTRPATGDTGADVDGTAADRYLTLPRHERDRLSTRTSMKSRAGGRSLFSTVSRAGRRWWTGRPIDDEEEDADTAALAAAAARARRVTRVGDLTGTDARDRLRKISGHDAATRPEA